MYECIDGSGPEHTAENLLESKAADVFICTNYTLKAVISLYYPV